MKQFQVGDIIQDRIENWIFNWVDLVCVIIRLITFGFYYPIWDMEIRCIITKYHYNIINKKRNKK